MSLLLNGGVAEIDLGAGLDIDVTTTAFTIAMWVKKTLANWVDYDPPFCFSGAVNARGESIEMHASGSPGASSGLSASINGGGSGLSAISMARDIWYYVVMTRPAGGTSFTNAFFAGTESGLTTYEGFPHTASGTYRYLRIGDLAQTGLVTRLIGEAAQMRGWASQLGAADMAALNTLMLAEANSASPVITSNLVFSLPWDDASDTTDQSGNGVAWTSSGTVTNGASHPPPGAASGGGPTLLPLFYRGSNTLLRL